MGLVSAPAPQLLVAGVGVANSSSFSPVASMSAFASFPWVRACVDAICTDLSGLPLVVVQGEGAKAQQVTVQGLSQLLLRPTSRKRRATWERQIVTHLLLSGNAYLLRAGPDPRRPVSLPILHPESIRIIPNDAGEAEAYEYRAAGGGLTVYDASVVVHIALTSWENGAQGLYGEGLIRALRNDLEADQAASKLSAAQSNQGRPSAIFKPKEPITREQQDMVADAYRKIASEKRPSMVLPADFDVDFPAFTLRDMEFVDQRTYTRDSILAAFGVPPTRVGLPSANYATAQEQSKIYWRQLQGIAALIDDALTELALGWGAYRVAHDFSSVDALQESRDARLNRVASWTMLGASPSDAAAYEGFQDAPLSDSTDQAQAEPVAVGASVRPVRAVQPKTLTFADWWTTKEHL
jgi:HK97 family phage portal protein